MANRRKQAHSRGSGKGKKGMNQKEGGAPGQATPTLRGTHNHPQGGAGGQPMGSRTYSKPRFGTKGQEKAG